MDGEPKWGVGTEEEGKKEGKLKRPERYGHPGRFRRKLPSYIALRRLIIIDHPIRASCGAAARFQAAHHPTEPLSRVPVPNRRLAVSGSCRSRRLSYPAHRLGSTSTS